MKLTSYDYFLPNELIAQTPAVPRDSSRLFIYNTTTNKIIFDHFYNLVKYLPQDSFMVLNNTKVLPARVILKKQTGGKAIILLLLNEKVNNGVIKAMVDRKVNVGDKLFIDEKHFFEVIKQEEHLFYLKYHFSYQWLLNKLTEIGKTPVPLYLRKTPLAEKELRKKYQTIFAAVPPKRWNMGSVAAPTASLHFSNRVFNRLDKKGIKKFFITLHLGLGTFAPITEENLKEKKLHEEYFEVDGQILQLINQLKSEGEKLVAVGTTVTRAIESLAKLKVQSEKLKIVGKTNLFIMPSYDFKMVDCLVTNFHLPKSSLMMLVEAFLQFKGAKRHLVDLYQIAIKEKFRFYSFGDTMLIL